MKRPTLHLLVVFLISSLATTRSEPISSKPSRKPIYQVKVRHNVVPPILDGRLSKNEWRNAAVVYNFTQKEPKEGRPASERTFILITYDESTIYFGIRCFDKEPKKIVANEMRRDFDLSENDYVEIIIDTFHDQRNSFYFATNSLGARLDSEIKNEGEYINWDWDGVWKSAAQRDNLGWTAEVAVPFQTLRYNNREELTWGINFGRYIARKREESFWSPITRNDDFDTFGKFKASKFGTLSGLRGIGPLTRFQVKPYAVAGTEKKFATASNNETIDIGLDAKIHLTSNIVSDVTFNTDFAQVEADDEQFNLSRFNLFFPEKRDFFLEGLDIFSIGEEVFYEPFTLLFHSRSVGLHRDNDTFELIETPIAGGIKLTGKEGPYEIGFLDVFTNEKQYTNLLSAQVTIPRTNHAAFRLKRDILKRSYLGVLALSKDESGSGSYNRTFAVDGSFSFDSNLNIKGYFAKTLTPGLKGNDINGFIDASWGTDKFYTQATYTDIGENFNPEMGFLQWTDIRKYYSQVVVSPRPHFLNTRQSHFSLDTEIITNHQNILQYRTLQPRFSNIFNNESFVAVGLSNTYDNVPSSGFYLGDALITLGIYKNNIVAVSYTSDLSRQISGSIQLGAGSFYNGSFQGLNFSNYFRPNDKLVLDVLLEWNRVDVPFTNGDFTTTILGTRFSYAFSTDLFVKAFIQWNRFEKRVVGNFLLNFIHTPGSDFFLVYNKEWLRQPGFNFSNHSIVAKFTYLLGL